MADVLDHLVAGPAGVQLGRPPASCGVRAPRFVGALGNTGQALRPPS